MFWLSKKCDFFMQTSLNLITRKFYLQARLLIGGYLGTARVHPTDAKEPLASLKRAKVEKTVQKLAKPGNTTCPGFG